MTFIKSVRPVLEQKSAILSRVSQTEELINSVFREQNTKYFLFVFYHFPLMLQWKVVVDSCEVCSVFVEKCSHVEPFY